MTGRKPKEAMRSADPDTSSGPAEAAAAPAGRGGTTRWARRALVALGVAGAISGITKAAAARLKRKPDPEEGELLSEPLGEKGRYVKSFDGTRIYTEEIGEGENLVLVHGWFCNTDMWHYQKKLLSDRFRMVCYDQRGHRRSDCPGCEMFTLEDLARDLRTVLDEQVGDGSAVLAGHSMGGMSILKFLEMFPEEMGTRVKGVALVDTTNDPMSRTMLGGRALDPMRRPVEGLFRWASEHDRLADGVKRIVVGTAPFLLATRYLGYGGGASVTQMEYISEMAVKTSLKGACLAGLGLLEFDDEIMPLEKLRESGIPVLIWVGEKDKMTRPESSIRMKQHLPEADFRLVPDTGHPSYMEEYGLFNEALVALASRSFARKD